MAFRGTELKSNSLKGKMYICTVFFHCVSYQMFNFNAKVMQIIMKLFVLNHWWWILTLPNKNFLPLCSHLYLVFLTASKNKEYSRITVKQTES